MKVLTEDERKANVDLVWREVKRPPDDAVFQLREVRYVSVPHPFVIGARHVAYAADHCCGMLSNDAIRASRVPCEHRSGGKRCQLSVDEHEHNLAVFVAVPREFQEDLNACPGLHAYLLAIKAQGLPIDGFAFPAIGEVTDADVSS